MRCCNAPYTERKIIDLPVENLLLPWLLSERDISVFVNLKGFIRK